MVKLPGNYIAGFVDGEGCFALKFRRDVRHDRKNKPVYFYWDIEFAIMLKSNDAEILEKIKNTLECGIVGNVNKRGTIRYAVNDLDDLSDKIVPFFQKYPLMAKKRHDFELWKEAIEIFAKNQKTGTNIEKGKRGFQKTNWDSKDIERLTNIHGTMKQYKGGNRGDWKWLK